MGRNDELFDEIQRVIAELERTGRPRDASTLRSGFRGLNGLTDGWALLSESLENVYESLRDDPSNPLRREVADLRDAVSSVLGFRGGSS